MPFLESTVECGRDWMLAEQSERSLPRFSAKQSAYRPILHPIFFGEPVDLTRLIRELGAYLPDLFQVEFRAVMVLALGLPTNQAARAVSLGIQVILPFGCPSQIIFPTICRDSVPVSYLVLGCWPGPMESPADYLVNFVLSAFTISPQGDVWISFRQPRFENMPCLGIASPLLASPFYYPAYPAKGRYLVCRVPVDSTPFFCGRHTSQNNSMTTTRSPYV